jgi:hypothetical protein
MNVALPFVNFAALFPGRKARSHAVRVTALCTTFAALLATGFQHRRDLAELLSSAMSRPAFIRGGGLPGQADVMRPLDPRSGFADARVGLMLFASYNSDVCRRALFDNRTGVSAEAGKIHCGQLPEQQGDQLGQERALAMLKAFRK